MGEREPEEIEVEVPAVTAPTAPWEIVLHNSTTFFQRMVGGGMLLKFLPVVATPEGYVPVPPGVGVEFSAEAWERFKREVEADGERPRVQVARSFGGGPLNGREP